MRRFPVGTGLSQIAADRGVPWKRDPGDLPCPQGVRESDRVHQVRCGRWLLHELVEEENAEDAHGPEGDVLEKSVHREAPRGEGWRLRRGGWRALAVQARPRPSESLVRGRESNPHGPKAQGTLRPRGRDSE